MDFNYRTTAYLESLQSVMIKTGYEIVGFDWPKNLVCINKVDHWKKRNGKVVKVFHHFRQWYVIPEAMIKWHKVTKKGFNHHWVWADDPEYTYTVDEKYISRGDARTLLETYKSLPKANPYK